ncbi:hypothetical protein BGZ65_001793 [Modicella reniformis]|uniref:Uncharacterized protein n=1 Tax=Modicella reniformis TaxID=1440133 RepID=A0A9P6MBR2_9FUNG|nr:hypothetical protein BGZ65_001793 [Modicella reniformis]
MPRPKISTNPTSTTTAAAGETLNDLSSPPSPVSTLPSSPLSALTSSITLKTPNQQYLHDSTRSLPIGTTLSISRKNGASRIGQSILGHLFASHKPSRDHQRLSNDATLSLETIRPKDQQRRSILPTNWTTGLSKPTSMQGLSLKSPPPLSGGKVASGDLPAAGRDVMEIAEVNEYQQPMLPSVWLESVLSRLSRSDLKSSPPYATLPRAGLSEHKSTTPLRTMFAELDPKPKQQRDMKTSRSKIKPMSSNSTLDQSKTMSRRGSACEVALGDDARILFQQKRPKTLSSAVISSSIMSTKESLGAVRQRPLNSGPALSRIRG